MSWAELPVKLKLYIFCVASISVPVVAWAGWDLLARPQDVGWTVLTLFAVLAVLFSLRLPSISATITVGDAYIMAIAMMYGVAPCVAATFLHTLLISVFRQGPRFYIHKAVFNTSSTMIAASVYSYIYQAMSKGSLEIQKIIVPSIVLVVVYFLVNSILTSIAISWAKGEKVGEFWVKSCIPLGVDYSISAVCATIIVTSSNLHQLFTTDN